MLTVYKALVRPKLSHTSNQINQVEKVLYYGHHLGFHTNHGWIWAGPWENVSNVICEQQRRRSACASAQSDQRLCCSLLRWYNISRFYSRNFKTLASFCGCAGRFVSGLVGNSRRHVLSCRGSYAGQVSQDLPLQKPCWDSTSISCFDKFCMILLTRMCSNDLQHIQVRETGL